jgi:hypothetical protein
VQMEMDEGGRHGGNDECRNPNDEFSGVPASFSEYGGEG